jgi:hypothetical protein
LSDLAGVASVGAAFGELLIHRGVKAARATKAQKTARFRAVVPALKLAA